MGKSWTQPFPFGPKEWWRKRAIVSYKDDRFRENEELGVDLEPDLTGDVEDMHLSWSDGGDVK